MSTVHELRELAKAAGIRGFSKAKKERLLEMLAEHQRKQEASPAPAAEAGKEAAEPEPEPVPAKKEYKPNIWANFLKDYREANKCSLKEAMRAKEAYAEYKAKHAPKAE